MHLGRGRDPLPVALGVRVVRRLPALVEETWRRCPEDIYDHEGGRRAPAIVSICRVCIFMSILPNDGWRAGPRSCAGHWV